MSTRLKLLAAAACICVIGIATYLGVDAWRKQRAAAASAALAEQIRAELFSLAEAAPGDTAKVRAWCQGVADKLVRDVLADDVKKYAEELRKNCYALGYF